jgi:proliferating cell nuclear antigen
MFEAKIADGMKLKKIVDAIKDLVADVNIDTTATGISLQAMDSSHIALVSLMLHQEGFETFRWDKPFTIGVSIANLAKVLKLAGNEDSITLKAEENPTYLTIILENQARSKQTIFQLNLLNLDIESMGIPDTPYTSEITMNSNEFLKLCKELSVISEAVTITTSMEFVKFSVEGDIGNGWVKINTSNGEINTRDDDDESNINILVKLSFSLKYLSMFTKASTLSNEVRLQMAADTPLVVEYQIPELGGLYYYLAPKLNEDEKETEIEED